MIETNALTIESSRKLLDTKQISARDLATAYLAEIERKDGDIGAYLEVFSDVLDRADLADKKIAAGEAQTLTGIPCALKDNILRTGYQATAASRILDGYVATYDSYVGAAIDGAGAVVLGRTNMDEFAMGSSTETSAYKKTVNPVDPTRVPGGSSGGSAAAVAAGEAIFSLGTDTGGSIRQPAAFCGLVGLYPTYGTVSRRGVIALGSSLDQVGPLTKTVTDAELVYQSIAGYDDQDSTSIPMVSRKGRDGAPKKIGVPRGFLAEGEGIDAEVLAVFAKSLEQLAAAGYEIIDVEIPHIELALAMYYIIQPAEASSNLARYDGMRYGARVLGQDLWSTYEATRGAGFGPEVRRRMILGTYVLSAGYYDAYYGQAQAARSLLKQSFAEVFDQVDIIATPTTPTPAFAFGEHADPVSMYKADLFAVPANMAQIPGLSVPAGKSNEGLPIGIQFLAPAFNEHQLFSVGKDFEQARGDI